MNNNNALIDLRKKIISIDEKILKFLYERKQVTIKIAKEKIKINKPIRDVKRENDLIQHLTIIGKKYNLNINYIDSIFKCIINYSIFTQNKVLQKQSRTIKNNEKVKFSFLGPKGSYSHIASLEYIKKNFKESIELSCFSFKEVLKCVENNEADIGILPIENNNSGAINDVYDLLKNTNLSIIGELLLPINHCLLTKKKQELKEIKKVYSHPQSFQQCSNFISFFKKWKLEHTDSTASAMKIVALSKDYTIAALGNEKSGSFYNLTAIKKNIANYKKNITRFIILSAIPIYALQNLPSKTTLIMSINYKSGSLVKALNIIQKNNLSMSKIISRPMSENTWEENFYIDIKSNLFSKKMQKSLNELYIVTKSLKILGCYPIDDLSCYNKKIF